MGGPHCVFCDIISDDVTITFSNENAVAFLDDAPVSPGHTLVVSRRHEADFFELTPAEQRDVIELGNLVRRRLLCTEMCDGFTAGWNLGEAAGQTVFHSHLHLIPRWHGDIAPGGLRGIPRLRWGSDD
jgi:diadenosine tetraphosphate (Ap4A) HIT family hydrolase